MRYHITCNNITPSQNNGLIYKSKDYQTWSTEKEMVTHTSFEWLNSDLQSGEYNENGFHTLQTLSMRWARKKFCEKFPFIQLLKINFHVSRVFRYTSGIVKLLRPILFHSSTTFSVHTVKWFLVGFVCI